MKSKWEPPGGGRAPLRQLGRLPRFTLAYRAWKSLLNVRNNLGRERRTAERSTISLS
jgi:hypothetical protein